MRKRRDEKQQRIEKLLFQEIRHRLVRDRISLEKGIPKCTLILSQKELAARAKLSRSMLSDLLTGRRRLNVEQLHKLLKALDLELRDLVLKDPGLQSHFPDIKSGEIEMVQKMLTILRSHDKRRLGLKTQLDLFYQALSPRASKRPSQKLQSPKRAGGKGS